MRRCRANGLNALRHAVEEYRRDHELKLHLLHVQPRLSRHIARFVSRGDRNAWHRERADAALASARELLSRAGYAAATSSKMAAQLVR